MAGADRSFKIVFDIEANAKNMEKAMADMRSGFSKLNLSDGFNKELNKTFTQLEQELTKLRGLTSKDTFNSSELNTVIKSFERLTNLYNTLKVKHSQIKGMSLDKLIPPNALKDLKSFQSLLQKLDNLSFNNLQEEINKVSQKLAEAKTKQDELKKAMQNSPAVAAAKQQRADDTFKQFEDQKKRAEELKKVWDDLAKVQGKKRNEDAIKQAAENYSSATKEAERLSKAYNKAAAAASAANEAVTTSKEAYNAQTTKVKELQIELNGLKDSSGNLQNIKQEISQLANIPIDKLPNDIQQLKILLEDLAKQKLDGTTQELKNIETAGKNADRSIEQLNDELRKGKSTGDAYTERAREIDQLANRVKYFFSLTNAVLLFRRAIKAAVSTVKELDEVMTQAAVVTKFTVGDMWKQLPEYAQRANELGVTIKGVYEASTLYYQQGLETVQVIGVANETLKMAKIAGLDYATATDYMTSALRGFNMEVNELSAQRVNDVYSQLAAKTASNVEELATAMSKTAPLAHNAGMEIETTAALLAQMIETTREAPETLGTAMKTVIARFQELKKDPALIEPVEGEVVDANKIEGALRTIGVALRDTSGQFRDLDEVFLEISQKWDGLSTNTQRYIATLAAGSRQQSRFIAMMSDYSRTVDLVKLANNAAGASQEQFEKTLESMQSKVDRLKNAWNEFVMGLANNQVIKFVIDALSSLINGLNKLIDTLSFGSGLLKSFFDIGALAIGIALGKKIFIGFFGWLLKDAVIKGKTAGEAFSISFNSGLKGINFAVLTGELKDYIKLLFSVNGATRANAALNLGMASATSTAAGAQLGLNAALLACPIGWYIVGITAIVAIIARLIKYNKENSFEGKMKAAAEETKAAKEAAEKAKQAYDELLEDKSEYDSLQEKLETLTYGTLEWKEALVEANNQVLKLIETYPKLASALTKGKFGQFTISESGWEDYIKEQNQEVAAGQALSFIKQIQESRAKVENIKNEYSKEIDKLLSGREYLNQTTKTDLATKEALERAVQQGVTSNFTDFIKKEGINSFVGRTESSFGDNGVISGQEFDSKKIEEAGQAILKHNIALKEEAVQAEKTSFAISAFLLDDNAEELGKSADGIVKLLGTALENKFEGINTDNLIPDDVLFGKNNNLFVFDETKATIEKIGKEYDKNFKSTKTGPKKALIELYAKMKNVAEDDIAAQGMSRQELAEAIQQEYAKKITEDLQKNTAKFTEQFIKLEDEELKKNIEVALTNGESFKDDLGDLSSNIEAAAIEIYNNNQEFLHLIYDSVDDFVEAYTSGINEGKKRFAFARQQLSSRNIRIEDFGQGMDAGMISGLSNHLIEIFLASGSEKAEAFGQKIQNIFAHLNEINPKKAEDFMSALLSLDWKSIDSVRNLSDSLTALGISATDLSEKNIDTLEKEICNLADAAASVDLQTLIDQIRELGQAAYDIKSGNKNTFSKEEIETFVSKGIADDSDFYYDYGEKAYRYTGDLEEFGETLVQTTSTLAEEGLAIKEEQIARAELAKSILENEDYVLDSQKLNAAMETGQLGISKDALYRAYDTNDTEQLETWLQQLNQTVSDLPRFIEEKQKYSDKIEVEALQIEYGDNPQDFITDFEEAQLNFSNASKEIIKRNLDPRKTVYGNVDLNNRQRLEWTEENKTNFAEALKSWGEDPKNISGYSTVLGSSSEFGGQEIAFSPILQTADGPILLGKDTVNKYIQDLITEAEKNDGQWSNDELFKLDAEGLEIDGQKINNLLADIGETAIKTGNNMHYIGDFIDSKEDYESFQKIFDNPNTLMYFKNLAIAVGASKEELEGLNAQEVVAIQQAYKSAQTFDINTEEIKKYADQLQRADKSLTRVQAIQLALGNNRLNKGVKGLIDTYEDWTKVLDATGGKLRNLSSEEANIVQELSTNLTTMFDLTEEQANDLIENHYNLIKQVAEGSKEALAQLQEEAAREVALDIKAELHDEEAIAAIDAFAKFLDTYDLPELEPSMDLTNAWAGYDEFVKICSNLLTSGATTVEGLKAIFTNLGLEGDVEWVPQGEHDVVTPIIQAQERGTGALTNLTGEEIQSLKVKYWTPKFTFKSIGSGGGGVSPTITPASPSGGGGGGSSSEDKTWENPYDWLYNLTQKINAELRTREKLERRYQRLLKTYSGTGEDLKKIADQELASLEKRKQYEQEMIKLRRQELKEYLAANAALAKYAQIDWELEVVRIDWNQINAVTDPEEGEAIEKYIDKLEELIQSIRDAEDAIDDIDDEIIDLKQRGRDQYRDLEDRVLDALISQQQDIIDEQERIYDAVNDAASDLVNAISNNIEKLRQDRQNEETETSLAEKERRLAYLRQDTTGSNALEIKKLEQDLDKEKQNYTDTLIDQGLNDLKEQNDHAAEQREKQIELMQSTLDWQQQTGYWVDEATRIVREGIGPNGMLTEDSELYRLLFEQEHVASMSNASQAWWLDNLKNTVAQAYLYLENALKPAEAGATASSVSDRDIMAEIRAQAATGRANNNGMSELQSLENERNAKIDALGVEDTWNKTRMVENYNNGYNSYKDSTDGSTDWMAKINESIGKQAWDNAFYYAGKRDAKLKTLNDSGASSIYSSDFTFEIVLEKWYEATKSHTYKTGGLADFTGPAWLDGSKSKPEMVLNARDTENFLQLKDILSNLRMSFSGSKGALGGDWYFDIDINVGEIASDYDVDQLTERVKQSIYTESTYRNVNAINFLK